MDTMNEYNKKPIIFIDVSYYIFHTYFHVFHVFRQANSEIEVEKLMIDPEFLARFDAYFKSGIRRILKKYSTTYRHITIAKDCGRANIWRKQLYNGYKENRNKGSKTFNVGIFSHVYTRTLPSLELEYGLKVVEYDNAEADDIIAVLHSSIRKYDQDRQIVIITNDHDYVQLGDTNTHIINMKMTDLTKKAVHGCDKYLKYKILAGDLSDNITPVIDPLSEQYVWSLVNNKTFFKKHMLSDNFRDKYYLNRKLIDFRFIPIPVKYGIKTAFKNACQRVRHYDIHNRLY